MADYGLAEDSTACWKLSDEDFGSGHRATANTFWFMKVASSSLLFDNTNKAASSTIKGKDRRLPSFSFLYFHEPPSDICQNPESDSDTADSHSEISSSF